MSGPELDWPEDPLIVPWPIYSTEWWRAKSAETLEQRNGR
jgi:hypothetical protein